MAGSTDLLTAAQNVVRILGDISQWLKDAPVVLTVSTGGPSITAGIGAPTAVMPAASLFLRTDGALGTRLYVSAGGGAWNAVSGV